MAFKLSSYYWFRNNFLLRSLEDVHIERAYFNKELSKEDRKTLKFILDELDILKEDSNSEQGKSMIAVHALVPNVMEFKHQTRKPELATNYLQGIHGIMEKYNVQIEMYKQLGDCYNEIGAQPTIDVAEAIRYANDKISFKQRNSRDHMWWSKIKEYKARGLL